ncbi:isochorismate synthase [Providencia rettgeri]|nr:isochorismate synthase [Providencia rettgeri]
MEETLIEYEVDTLATLSPDSFLFTSPYQSFSTTGCFCQLTTPAKCGENLSSIFQKDLIAAFDAAKMAGITNPIIVGALPFNTDEPSTLFVPQSIKKIIEPFAESKGSKPNIQVSQRREYPNQQQFTSMVEQAISTMRTTLLDKVVLARLLDIVVTAPLECHYLLQRLISQNPTSYNFHVPLFDGSRLLGASPELLIRKQGHRFFSQPLAGSAPRNLDEQFDREISLRLYGSIKDHYEHQLVIQAMKALLYPRSHRLFFSEQPKLVSTPTLWHLATDIEGIAHSQENALSLACLLHPTPALNGFPYQLAKQFISQVEPFNRQLFGGIVGWCDHRGNGEWVVAIRCARIKQNYISLFAGAGIVPDSSPLSEWQETGAKLSTMLNVLGLN